MTVEIPGVADMPGLFAFVETKFRDFAREFARHGAPVDPGLEVRIGTGLLCYYDLNTRRIDISFPDPGDPVGKIQFLFMRELLGFPGDDAFARFMYLIMPRLLAHEMGHALRHSRGRFGADPWLEEQIANQFAGAVTTRRYSPVEMDLLLDGLTRAVAGLSEKVEPTDSAVGSYGSPLHALNVIGSLSAGALDGIQVVEKLFALNPEDVLQRMESVRSGAGRILERRADLITDFNRRYGSDIVRYLFYQLGWTLLDLRSRERQYLDDLIRRHLGTGEDVLPPPPEASPSEESLAALYRCHRDAASRSEAVSRYFFKRYRSVLLNLILESEAGRREAAPLGRPEVRPMIENWEEKDFDVLDGLEQVVPPDLRRLFPAAMKRAAGESPGTGTPVLTGTDLRIWEHVMRGSSDDAARRTVECLTILDGIEGFRSLPADILIEMAGVLCRLECGAGETVIREGSNNADVFILISGGLDVLVSRDGAETRISTVHPGEVFGEMSFLTGESRSATVRAAEESECFVLRASDLRLFAAREPAILLQIARVLARRLKRLNEAVGR